MRRSAAIGRGLDDFMLALSRSTMTGDVIPVVLRHSTTLLGAPLGRLTLRNGSDLRCWAIDGGEVSTWPLDPTDEVPGVTGDIPASPQVRRCEFVRAGIAGHGLVAEGPSGDDSSLMLWVGRLGRRPFDDRAVKLLESVITFSDVALQNMHLLARLQDKADALEHLATHDPLTGLANRRMFREKAERALQGSRVGAVLLVDLDRFKEVNDTLGHHVGDQLLVEVARRLRESVGGKGLISRLGGDEFAVLLPPGHPSDIQSRARQLHGDLERPVEVGDMVVDVGASIGVAMSAPDHPSISTMLRHADVAMYAAKEANTPVEVYAPVLDHYRPESLELVARFRGAVERGELHVAYQPQFDTHTDRVIGVEALARWAVPGIGPIQPSEFIPIAESTGLIRPLTRQILVQAMEQCMRWQTTEARVRVSVNIAPRVLLDPSLASQIVELLDLTGLPPELLRLEVTETTVMTDPARATAVLRDLTDRGMSIAIDDFGTGHSSLSYLTSLPCHEIKIDRTFITALDHGDRRAEAVVASMIGLGRDLGIDVIAEGVETARAAEQLQRLGCRVAQGYLYSRPVLAGELARVLAGASHSADQTTSLGGADHDGLRRTGVAADGPGSEQEPLASLTLPR